MIVSRKVLLCAAVVAGALSLNDTRPMSENSFLSQAQARVGRPLTPMSYAGVARRTTRRAVAVGAAAGAAGVYYGSTCRQVVDAYGNVVTRC